MALEQDLSAGTIIRPRYRQGCVVIRMNWAPRRELRGAAHLHPTRGLKKSSNVVHRPHMAAARGQGHHLIPTGAYVTTTRPTKVASPSGVELPLKTHRSFHGSSGRKIREKPPSCRQARGVFRCLGKDHVPTIRSCWGRDRRSTAATKRSTWTLLDAYCPGSRRCNDSGSS